VRSRDPVVTRIRRSGPEVDGSREADVVNDGAEVLNLDSDRIEPEDVRTGAEGNAEWLSYTDLMMDSYPPKSKMIYLKAYKMFERYLKSQKQFVPNVFPKDVQILNYFHYLKHTKCLAPTTLWSTYARVNACCKRLYGRSLKEYPSVTEVLKGYESGYSVKKASIFSPAEVCTN
jgi:hypothetical protein